MAKRLPIEAIDAMPQELQAGIGRVIALWGYLEFQLGVVIREACGLDKETGNLLTNRTNMQTLCNSLRAIAKSDHWITDNAVKKKIVDLARAVQDAKDVRNDYAHGVFSDGATQDSFALLKYVDKGDRAPTLVPVSMATLATAEQVPRDLWQQAQGLTKQLKASNKKR